jgi:hypothetical protein
MLVVEAATDLLRRTTSPIAEVDSMVVVEVTRRTFREGRRSCRRRGNDSVVTILHKMDALLLSTCDCHQRRGAWQQG